jgi:hypothetical protein
LWEEDEYEHHNRREPQKKSADPAGLAVALFARHDIYKNQTQ